MHYKFKKKIKLPFFEYNRNVIMSWCSNSRWWWYEFKKLEVIKINYIIWPIFFKKTFLNAYNSCCFYILLGADVFVQQMHVWLFEHLVTLLQEEDQINFNHLNNNKYYKLIFHLDTYTSDTAHSVPDTLNSFGDQSQSSVCLRILINKFKW